MSTQENSRHYVPACQGTDCAALKKANDWFGDLECTPVSEKPAAQARRDTYGDFA